MVDRIRYIELTGTNTLAMFWSYAVNHSILWAMFHFFVGPAYIAYRLVHVYPQFFK